jgi:hypothetical protein
MKKNAVKGTHRANCKMPRVIISTSFQNNHRFKAMRFVLCSMDLLEDHSCGEKAGEARSDDTM